MEKGQAHLFAARAKYRSVPDMTSLTDKHYKEVWRTWKKQAMNSTKLVIPLDSIPWVN